MKTNKKVCVIGAGVNGLSCAFLLQKAGYKVTIISKDDPGSPQENHVFASYFPSASIIPHSVYTENLLSLFHTSQEYFNFLHKHDYKGVAINEHYELFGFLKNPPAYAPLISNFERFDTFKNKWHPVHPSIQIESGWKFDCFFADWNLYYPALLEEFLNMGGEIIIQKLDRDSIHQLPWNYIINCAGAGSANLFEEINPLVFRGHLIHVENAPLLKNASDNTVSYNFSLNETAADVYCYPRQDGWILGGSRQKGELDKNDEWLGENIKEPNQTLDGAKIPIRIIEHNKVIIRESFNIDLDKFPSRKVKIGYRYVRDIENGLRLEAEELNDKLIIHNYGHGGAGVTLSWGCAKEVLSILKQKTGAAEN